MDQITKEIVLNAVQISTYVVGPYVRQKIFAIHLHFRLSALRAVARIRDWFSSHAQAFSCRIRQREIGRVNYRFSGYDRYKARSDCPVDTKASVNCNNVLFFFS
jgi:hypothetical protein